MRTRTTLFAFVLFGGLSTGLAVTSPAFAQSGGQSGVQSVQAGPQYGGENPKELFEGATRMAMKALELLIRTLPQYEPPVVLENGDILIRRKPVNPPVSPPDSDGGADAHRI
ncbi:hypothetical protein [Magnetovibrio sp.]|uniref:hypothetical protein n=1 Tax=Magnetovibrio sp. TaxID=2024836 RepID=UPI002F9375E0